MKRLLLLLPFMALLSFGAGAQTIPPNPDFETWTSQTYIQPDSTWYSSNAECYSRMGKPNDSSVTGYVSPHATKLQTFISAGDTQIAYISNVPFNPLTPFPPQAGRAYTSVVTQLHGYYQNYEYQNNDTSFLFVFFLNASNAIISRDTLKFTGATGGSGWTAFTKNLHLGTNVPSSVIIAALSSDIFVSAAVGPSWLMLDSLQFLGASSSQPILDGNFENRQTDTAWFPTAWNSESNGLFATGISRSSSSQHGSYAIQLVTQSSGGGTGAIFASAAGVTNGVPMNHYMLPATGLTGTPYSVSTPDTLMGYFKYAPNGNDTGIIMATLIKNGIAVGVPNILKCTAQSAYTQFKLGWGTPSATPDSIRIDILSSNLAPQAGSTFIVDNLSLKSQSSVSVTNVNPLNNSITVFPNPATNVLNIMLNGTNSGNVTVKIYDLTGKTLMQNEFGNSSLLKISVSQLPSGMYFYEVRDNETVVRNKFIKN